jgi:hypothetical protein
MHSQLHIYAVEIRNVAVIVKHTTGCIDSFNYLFMISSFHLSPLSHHFLIQHIRFAIVLSMKVEYRKGKKGLVLIVRHFIKKFPRFFIQLRLSLLQQIDFFYSQPPHYNMSHIHT